MHLLISETSFLPVDLLYVSTESGGKQTKTHIRCLLGYFFGTVCSMLLLLDLNKNIVQKLSRLVIIMESP